MGQQSRIVFPGSSASSGSFGSFGKRVETSTVAYFAWPRGAVDQQSGVLGGLRKGWAEAEFSWQHSKSARGPQPGPGRTTRTGKRLSQKTISKHRSAATSRTSSFAARSVRLFEDSRFVAYCPRLIKRAPCSPKGREKEVKKKRRGRGWSNLGPRARPTQRRTPSWLHSPANSLITRQHCFPF